MKMAILKRWMILKSNVRCKHWCSIENQFLQVSKIPTMHFQPSLPRLPIPKLENTCDRYLAAQKPLLTQEKFDRTFKYVTEFKNSEGKILQGVLETQDQNNKHTSYISEPWFDIYLKDRRPLPINYNPFLIFINDVRPEYNTQLLKTANMLISSLRFYKSLEAGILEPDVFHLYPAKSDTKMFKNICSILPSSVSWYGAYFFNAYPLDMSQYQNLFSSTRIPHINKDVLYKASNSTHILIQHKGNFYTFNALDENGHIISPEKIIGNLRSIIEKDVPFSQFPLGLLTTLERNEWAKLRQHLTQLGNKESLELIDSALLHVCLDDCDIGTDPVTLCRNYLHANGTNRWFDKSFSLIITKDGYGGINFEHSWGDGVAVLRYFENVYSDSTQNTFVNPNTVLDNDSSTVNKLEFNLDDKIQNAIIEADKEYQAICNALQLNIMQYDGFGKELCKKYGVSPDAVMQLGFQAAYHKLTGNFVASYESCSTAAFKHGRTETIRPCTTATKEFCIALNSIKTSTKTHLKDVLRQCSKIHGQLTKEAAMGQGFDRHLLALRLIAEKDKKTNINIFEDSAYKAINHNIISTSTLSSPALLAGGFGPVIKDGFGIGYGIRDNELGAVVTSYKGHSNGNDFIEVLNQSYKKILPIISN